MIYGAAIDRRNVTTGTDLTERLSGPIQDRGSIPATGHALVSNRHDGFPSAPAEFRSEPIYTCVIRRAIGRFPSRIRLTFARDTTEPE